MSLDHAINQLRKNGYKMNPQRQEILNAFIANNNNLPQRAEEIYRKVVERYPNINIDTVCRNLNELLDLGVISKLNFREGKSRYQLTLQRNLMVSGAMGTVRASPKRSEGPKGRRWNCPVA